MGLRRWPDSLTKLNWASSDSFTAEPITIKYAGYIAYLTAAFLRQKEIFNRCKRVKFPSGVGRGLG